MGDTLTGPQRRDAALAEHRLPAGEQSLTHQGHRWLNRGLAPLCSRCIIKDDCEEYSAEQGAVCQPMMKAGQAMIEQLMALPHLGALDAPLVEEYTRGLLFMRLVDTWANQVGPFTITKKKGTTPGILSVQPVLEYRLKVAAAVRRLAETLRLTPSTRAGIEGQAESMTTAIIAIDVEKQAAVRREGESNDT